MAWNGGSLKTCGCGRQHDETAWKALDLVGVWDDGEEIYELRNCPMPCGSSIAIVLGPSPAMAVAS